ATFSRAMSSSSRCPIVRPIRARRIVTGLSSCSVKRGVPLARSRYQYLAQNRFLLDVVLTDSGVQITQTHGCLDEACELLLMREGLWDSQTLLHGGTREHTVEPGLEVGIGCKRHVSYEREKRRHADPGDHRDIGDGE